MVKGNVMKFNMALGIARSLFSQSVFASVLLMPDGSQAAHRSVYSVSPNNSAAESFGSYASYFELAAENLYCRDTGIRDRPALTWKMAKAQLITLRIHQSLETDVLLSKSECESLRERLVQSHSPGLTLTYSVTVSSWRHCYPKIGCESYSREKVTLDLDGILFSDTKGL